MSTAVADLGFFKGADFGKVDFLRFCGLFFRRQGVWGSAVSSSSGIWAEPQFHARDLGSVLSSPAGSEAEPQPPTHFGEFFNEFYVIPSYLK